MVMKKDVTVYSTTWCGYCKMVKAYLKSKDVEFTEVDIEADPSAAERMVAMTGQMGVPVTTINSTTIIGYDRPAIDGALAA
jgi:glutaredoxin 3